MGKAIDYVEKRLREVEIQDILKAQLKVKFGEGLHRPDSRPHRLRSLKREISSWTVKAEGFL